MKVYLTENAYMRWYRQYQINIGHYIVLLDSLRIRLDTLQIDQEREELDGLMNEIDENLERAIPRNFINGGRLSGPEKFLENIKVLVNLLSRIIRKGDCSAGIYQAEKDRIMLAHQQFNFKEKINDLLEKVEALEARVRQAAMVAEQPVVAASG